MLITLSLLWQFCRVLHDMAESCQLLLHVHKSEFEVTCRQPGLQTQSWLLQEALVHLVEDTAVEAAVAMTP